MKILIIGNYYRDGSSQSMENYTRLLESAMSSASHEVQIIQPDIYLGKFGASRKGIGKWLAYADRFILFRNKFLRAAEWADLIHIADQANAMYARLVFNRPVLITCHDLLAVRSALGEIKEHEPAWTGRVYQRWILSGLRRANFVVCVSEATRDDVKRLTGLASEGTAVVYNPLNYPYRRVAKEKSEIIMRE